MYRTPSTSRIRPWPPTIGELLAMMRAGRADDIKTENKWIAIYVGNIRWKIPNWRTKQR